MTGMSTPPTQDEHARLAALRSYEILDTPPEPALDELTTLDAWQCEAPLDLVSLVDADRQWFKSRAGMQLSGTSREVSICAHAIRGSEVFVVPDTMEDERFARNPLVTSDPAIRFYAGAPLITPAGQALGTLCVMDRRPRVLEWDRKKTLAILARQVMAQLELRSQTREMAATEAMLRREAETARQDRETMMRHIEARASRLERDEADAKRALVQADRSRIALLGMLEDQKAAQQALRDTAARLRLLSQRMVEVEENERRHISRELHDRLGATLSALNLSLGIVQTRLSADALAAVGERLTDVQQQLQEAVRDVRDIMGELRPPALDEYGLLAALSTYCAPFSARVGILVEVEGEERMPRLSLAEETALFRIAQEALHNAAKHSGCSAVRISVACIAGEIVLGIIDDGAGYAQPDIRPGSWGLTTMAERAEAIGARLSIDSAPGAGTRIVVRLRTGG